ncbi:MAG: DUF1015 family protein [Candidatus Accumulibacter sp.]|nr:DUF1015 family protein [Accumulibacter sp.]
MSIPPPIVRAFKGLYPRKEHAAAVAAPPYDTVSVDEAHRLADGNPFSFLHISRAEIDLPEGTHPYAPEVYEKARENFDRLISSRVLLRSTRPRYYAYRLTKDDSHTQTGLVATASVAAYESGRIRRHELTRPDKENDRVRQIGALDAQTGPALLAHPDNDEAERLVAEIADGVPIIDLENADGVRHTLWETSSGAIDSRVDEVFGALPTLYIADGHHRSAAAARIAAARRGLGAPDSCEYFLSVIFPARQMRILSYNRAVRDLNGLSVGAFLEAVDKYCLVTPLSGASQPERTGVFSLCLGERWYRLAVRPEYIPVSDPVRRIDVSLLSETILARILGITDLRRDTRIDFVGGVKGLKELERRVKGGEMAAAFALHPTPLSELMSVADAGEIMPPKSTWFEPKLADGLVSHVLD